MRGEGSLAEGLGLGLLGPGCDPHLSVSRTFAPLWEVFRVSSDKLALCHLELTRKLQDLIKDVLRHGEEQLKAHKKVGAAGPVGGEWLWLLGSQDFWGPWNPSSWCVSLRVLLVPQHQTRNLTDLSIVEFQTLRILRAGGLQTAASGRWLDHHLEL